MGLDGNGISIYSLHRAVVAWPAAPSSALQLSGPYFWRGKHNGVGHYFGATAEAVGASNTGECQLRWAASKPIAENTDLATRFPLDMTKNEQRCACLEWHVAAQQTRANAHGVACCLQWWHHLFMSVHVGQCSCKLKLLQFMSLYALPCNVAGVS
jgi:hypothetical protein